MRPIVGIDPAFRKQGFAVSVIDETGEVATRIFKDGFLPFFRWLDSGEIPANAFWAVENSNLQDVTFNRGVKSPRAAAKQSRDAGKNMAVSQLVFDLLVYKFGTKNVLGVSPRQKGKKWGPVIVSEVLRQDGYKMAPRKNKLTGDEADAIQIALYASKSYKYRYNK